VAVGRHKLRKLVKVQKWTVFKHFLLRSSLITLHTVDFGVSVTSAVFFFKGCGSPSVFNLLSMLEINFFTSYDKFFYLGVIRSPR
jgi:hypothetical protein